MFVEDRVSIFSVAEINGFRQNHKRLIVCEAEQSILTDTFLKLNLTDTLQSLADEPDKHMDKTVCSCATVYIKTTKATETENGLLL